MFHRRGGGCRNRDVFLRLSRARRAVSRARSLNLPRHPVRRSERDMIARIY